MPTAIIFKGQIQQKETHLTLEWFPGVMGDGIR